MKDIKSIAVLLACHNRLEATIICLSSLFEATLPEGYSLEVFLVNDGSTDGTGEVVATKFPEINVIEGDGNLYWTRGMHLAWETAINWGVYDFYLWLNDDVKLLPNIFVDLLEVEKINPDSVICGVTCSRKNSEVTYGGRNLKGKLLIPNGKAQQFEGVFNGNIVLIPRTVFKLVGNLDVKFKHAIGDFDYAMRVKKNGIKTYITPRFTGICEQHDSFPKWCLPEVSFSNRIKSLYSPLGNAQPKYFFLYELRHFGIFHAIKHLVTIHLRLIFPSLWKH